MPDNQDEHGTSRSWQPSASGADMVEQMMHTRIMVFAMEWLTGEIWRVRGDVGIRWASEMCQAFG